MCVDHNTGTPLSFFIVFFLDITNQHTEPDPKLKSLDSGLVVLRDSDRHISTVGPVFICLLVFLGECGRGSDPG